MRRRIALPKHFVRNPGEAPVLFRVSFRVRTRPLQDRLLSRRRSRVALTYCRGGMRVCIGCHGTKTKIHRSL
jgi:hypothetical protein